MLATRTRIRTQTALNDLVKALGEAKGEQAHLRSLLEAGSHNAVASRPEALYGAIQRRLDELQECRFALEVAIRHFDDGMPVERVAPLATWMKKYGRGAAALRRYEVYLMTQHGVLPSSPPTAGEHDEVAFGRRR